MKKKNYMLSLLKAESIGPQYTANRIIGDNAHDAINKASMILIKRNKINELFNYKKFIYPVFGIKYLLIILFLIFNSACSTEKTAVQILEKTVSEPTIEIKIYSPNETDLYPQNEVTWASYPLILKFKLNILLPKNWDKSLQPVRPIDISQIEPLRIPIKEFDYFVYAAYGEPAQFEEQPFFNEKIDLYGKTSPGSIIINPGVYIPDAAIKIKIRAVIYYESLAGQSTALREIDVHPYPEDQLYHRYRDGYLKRHLLESGRGLSWIWLKEYEPGKDRKELLYHGKTYCAPSDHTRVYVPWKYDCKQLSTWNEIFNRRLGAQNDIPLENTDFDGDGKTDMVVWRPSNGYWYIRTSRNDWNNLLTRQWGENGDIPIGSSDFDGDGKADMVVWRAHGGYWNVRTSRSEWNESFYRQLGTSDDIPLSNTDFDGDGKTDMVVWRPSNGYWYIRTSRSDWNDIISRQFGTQNDIPFGNTDFDGDGKSDLTVWRPSNGTWYVCTSSSDWNESFNRFGGGHNDIPMPLKDLDGDGKTDLAVWRPGNYWYFFTSGTQWNESFHRPLGSVGDIPIPNSDFDGDGRTDLVIWNPSLGRFHIATSSSDWNNYLIRTLGIIGGIPLSCSDYNDDNQADLAVWQPENGTWYVSSSSSNKCSYSIKKEADAIYGSNENPLLRGGLAMATFSLEYLSEENYESLNHAIKLFEYVQACEWVNPSGYPTGFFLRSKWPACNCQQTGREYCYASTDEIIGMVLGLYYLDLALKRALNYSEYYAYYHTVQTSLKQLVIRLARQLRTNYYFIVPPLAMYPDATNEIPQERQTGWSGTYMFQWYLTGAFKSITGNRYSPDDQIDDEHPAWKRFKRLPWKGNGKDDKNTIELLLDAELTSAQRAIYAIQGTGIGMYYYGTPFSICDRLVAHGYFSDEEECATLAQFAAYFGKILFQSDFDPSEVTEYRTFDDFNWFNFPMLLHAFQLGMADNSRDPEVVYDIKKWMARVIKGVLAIGGDYTDLDLDELCEELGLIEGLICYQGNWEIREHVGTSYIDHDYYAATIANHFNLQNMYFIPTEREEFENAIDETLNAAKSDFYQTLPVGKRSIQDIPGLFPTNPEHKIGRAFCWEKPLTPTGSDINSKRRQYGGSDGDAGLENESLQKLIEHDPPIDALCEGAGLGYLLPTALMRLDNKDQYPVYECFSTENTNYPYLGLCFTKPQIKEGLHTEKTICDFSFPYLRSDEFDIQNRNDVYTDASDISWGCYKNLSIDKSTPANYDLDRFYTEESLRTHYIPLEQDRDFYKMVDDEGYGLFISAESPNIAMKVYVDNLEGEHAEGDFRRASISVPSGNDHIIMVTSYANEIMTKYRLNIESLPRAEKIVDSTLINTPVNIKLIGSDRINLPMTYNIITNPEHGTLTGIPPNIIYSPAPGFVGEDNFSFNVNNGIGDSNNANVKINVTH